MKTQKNPSSIRRTLRKKSSGFTLVEVLVVITIIVVLVAVVLSVTNNIRNKAQQANAMNAIRQVGTASIAYSAENHGDIMTIIFEGDPRVTGGNANWLRKALWNQFQPYLFPGATATNNTELQAQLRMGVDQLFNTKDARTMNDTVIGKGVRIYRDTSTLPVPIAFNRNLHEGGKYKKVGGFGNPSEVLYATYGFGLFTEEHGQSYVPRPTDGSMPTNRIYYLDDRKALAIFLDGHAELVSPPMPARNFK
jgi:prepilin-type N-terminal cleavage/methylation domain-containing protein